MSLNWTTIKMYLTPPLTPPFQNGGVKSFDELIDLSPEVSPAVSDDTTDKSLDELTNGSTNGSVKSFDQLIDKLWSDFIKSIEHKSAKDSFKEALIATIEWSKQKMGSILEDAGYIGQKTFGRERLVSRGEQ